METVLDAPFSRIADAFRHMSAVLITRQEPERGSVVCVVSSVPNEGKTAVTANLGALMAAGSKWRVLVIDCDLHRGSLTHNLAPDATEGLIEALADPSRLSSLVLKRERSRLHVLPCVTQHRPPDAAELLGSAQMARIFEETRKSYDFIIIEVPPVMTVADVKMLEHHVDQFVLVAEWGVTKKRLISEALFEVDGLRERLSCVVLNKADPAFLRQIEAFKGPKIAHYYEG
jgi:succinoglycan biosynthesis transport protein ExoP